MNYWNGHHLIRRISSVKDYDLSVISKRITELKRQRLYQTFRHADATIVWERISNGYRIIDLQLDNFLEALRFVLTNYTQTEPLSKAVALWEDPISMRSYLDKMFEKMSENISLCALQDGSSELVGVLVASEFSLTGWNFSLMRPGEGLRQIMMLRNYAMESAHLSDDMENPVRIDVFCVALGHQKKGIGTALLRSCLARASDVTSTFVGEFTSAASQTIAKRLQFKMLHELPYKDIGSEIQKFQVFESCYPANYSIACMVANVSPPPQYQPSVMSVSSRRQKPKKKKSKKIKKRK